MKKIFKLLYSLLIICILFTTSEVLAFTTTLSGNQNIDQNGTVTITMNLSGAADLIALDAVLTYDNSKLELISSSGKGGWQAVVASKIVASNASGLNGSGSIVSLNFKAKNGFAPGESTTISVSSVKGSNSNVERQTGNDTSITIRVNVPKSSNNNLSDLSVDGKKVNGFSSGNTHYDLGTTTANSINISATVEDSKAGIVGTGTKNINYGKNTFNVTVKAENGASKIYTIVITKPDNRSQDNSLASLSAKPVDLKFNKNTTSYSFKVENSVKSINIEAKASDSKAKVSGTGTKTLNDYANTFSIVVTAENGSTKTYTIRVIRKDADGNYGAVSKDNYLKSLSVEGYKIDFNKDVLEYNIEVENLVDSVNVKALVNHETATYEVEGNTKLSVGTNSVKVKVTSESGDVRTYIINVNRKSDAPTVIVSGLKDTLAKTTAKEVNVDIKDDNTILEKDVVKAIKDSKKKVLFNIYTGNLIKYAWLFDGANITKEEAVDLFVKFSSDNAENINKLTNYSEAVYLDVVHEGDIPNNTKIKIYVGDRFNDYDRVNIYSYNKDNNSMDTIHNNVEVLNGYVEFDVTNGNELILTRATLEKVNSGNIIWIIISVVEFVLLLGVGVFIFIKYKNLIKKGNK